MKYDDVLENLRKERIFSKINNKNASIESLANELEHVNLITIYSIEARTVTLEYNNDFIIIWDECYWKYFKEYLTSQKYARKIKFDVSKVDLSVMAHFLSEKYIKFKNLSKFMYQVKIKYDICPNLEFNEIDATNKKLLIAKAFVFFHEVGHIRFAQKDESILVTKHIILKMLSEIKLDHFSKLENWADLAYSTVQELLQGLHQDIMEELIADIFAVGKLAVYLKELIGGEFGITTIKEAVTSICSLSCYQNLFNIINKVWDSYYTEIRFGLKPRKKEIKNNINELEIVRNNLGNIISITLFLSYFDLNKNIKKEIWELYDSVHVDNSQVINIMTSDNFICTLIKESMQQ